MDVADLNQCLEPDEYVKHCGCGEVSKYLFRRLINLFVEKSLHDELMKFSLPKTPNLTLSFSKWGLATSG